MEGDLFADHQRQPTQPAPDDRRDECRTSNTPQDGPKNGRANQSAPTKFQGPRALQAASLSSLVIRPYATESSVERSNFNAHRQLSKGQTRTQFLVADRSDGQVFATRAVVATAQVFAPDAILSQIARHGEKQTLRICLGIDTAHACLRASGKRIWFVAGQTRCIRNHTNLVESRVGSFCRADALLSRGTIGRLPVEACEGTVFSLKGFLFMRMVICLFALLGLSPLQLHAGEPVLSASSAFVGPSDGVVSHAGSSCSSCNRGCNSCPDPSLDQVPGRCGLNGPGCAAGLWANYCNEKKPCWQPGMRHFAAAPCRPTACACGGLFGNCSHCRSRGSACSTGLCNSGCSDSSGFVPSSDDGVTQQPTPAAPDANVSESSEPDAGAEAPATPAERESLQPVPPPLAPEAAPAEPDSTPVPPAPRTSRRTASTRGPGRASSGQWPFGPAR